MALAATLFSQKINIHNLHAISSLFIGQEQSCMQLHALIFTVIVKILLVEHGANEHWPLRRYCKLGSLQGWQWIYDLTKFHVNWNSWKGMITKLGYYIMLRKGFILWALLTNSPPCYAQRNHQLKNFCQHFAWCNMAFTLPLCFLCLRKLHQIYDNLIKLKCYCVDTRYSIPRRNSYLYTAILTCKCTHCYVSEMQCCSIWSSRATVFIHFCNCVRLKGIQCNTCSTVLSPQFRSPWIVLMTLLSLVSKTADYGDES